MDKLKNIVNPGSKKDDEVMYGSGHSDDPALTGNTATTLGLASHVDSGRTAGNDPLSSSTNLTSSTGTTARDPMSTSTDLTGGSQYDSGNSGRGNHGLNEPYASRMPGGFDDDAATTASVSSGVPGQSQSRSGLTGSNDPTLDKPLPRKPASSGTGLMGSSGNNTTGTGRGLTGNEYPDRSVGRSGVGDQNYAPETGRSFPLGGSSNTTSGSNHPLGETGTYPASSAVGGSTTAGPHSSNLANKADPRVDSDLDGSRGVGSGTGPTASSANQGSLGRNAGVASGDGAGAGIGSGVSGYGPESWEHNHGRHGHTYEGDPCERGEVAPTGASHTSGPHITDTANRLDPHVGADGTTTGSTGHHRGHHGGEAALAGAGAGAGAGAYESSRDTPSATTGSTTGTGPVSSTTDKTGTSSTGKTAGPHKSDLLNKLDPRVDSDLSKEQSRGVEGAGLGSSTTGTTGTSDHHYGRDAGLASAGGAAAYEAEKHHRGNEPTSATTGMGATGTTSGMGSSDPYSSSGSGMDPRVDSSRSGLGRTNDTTGIGKDHYLGRDAALGAGAGGLAYEAERAHGKPTHSSTIPGDTTGSAYDSTRGPTGSSHDQAGTALAGSGHQPATSATGASPHDNTQPQMTSHHHTGRDAALGAGVGSAAYEAQKMHDTGRTDPGAQVRESTHPGASLATYPSRGYGNEGAQDPSHGPGHTHGHRKEDAAIAGGAGAGAGALAGHEMSKKEEKKLEKEHEKELKHEQKEHDKELKHEQKEHHKEEKALEKEHSKELKAHEKERAKHEKAIEDEKKHEKAMEKEEKKEEKHEKKHGGLLGFLHRDKPDKEPKEDEARRKAEAEASGHVTSDRRDYSEETSAGMGTRSDPLAGEHGTQSGVHDTPIGGDSTHMGSGITTHDAYGTHEGQNKLHKDPPTKVLESRGLDTQDSGTGY